MAKGATVLAGGKARPDIGPYVYEPTVLEGVTDDMEVARKETFGPVVSLYTVARRRRGGAAGERLQVRAQRLGVVAAQGSGRGPPRGSRGGEHQRGLRGRVGIDRRADGRMASIRPGPAPTETGTGCSATVHRGADPGGAERDRHRHPVRHGQEEWGDMIIRGFKALKAVGFK